MTEVGTGHVGELSAHILLVGRELTCISRQVRTLLLAQQRVEAGVRQRGDLEEHGWSVVEVDERNREWLVGWGLGPAEWNVFARSPYVGFVGITRVGDLLLLAFAALGSLEADPQWRWAPSTDARRWLHQYGISEGSFGGIERRVVNDGSLEVLPPPGAENGKRLRLTRRGRRVLAGHGVQALQSGRVLIQIGAALAGTVDRLLVQDGLSLRSRTRR